MVDVSLIITHTKQQRVTDYNLFLFLRLFPVFFQKLKKKSYAHLNHLNNTGLHLDEASTTHHAFLCGKIGWRDSFVFVRLISAGNSAIVPMKLWIVLASTVDFIA